MTRLDWRFLLCVLMAFAGCSGDEEGETPAYPEGPKPPEAAVEKATPPTEDPAPAPEKAADPAEAAAIDSPQAQAAVPAPPIPGNTAAAAIPEDPPGPTSVQCLAALESMVTFTVKMGGERHGSEARKEFLIQCVGWPVESVRCLIAAKEPAAVVQCMKPIAELENRKARQAVQKKAVEEQSRLLAAEAQKRADAIESVLDSEEGAKKAPPAAPTR